MDRELTVEELEDRISHLHTLSQHPGWHILMDSLMIETSNQTMKLPYILGEVDMRIAQGYVQGMNAAIEFRKELVEAMQSSIRDMRSTEEQEKPRELNEMGL